MYETLTRWNPATHTVGPLLATSWSSADGGKTWTFHLRHGVHFHTGRLRPSCAPSSWAVGRPTCGARSRPSTPLTSTRSSFT
jgi:ABC-type transport system substrate-binding protein